jgi:hypothetical protein
MDQTALTQMADLLNSDGINYGVFLQAYVGDAAGAHDVTEVVKRLVGDDVIVDEIREVDIAEVVQDVSDSLCYAGDSGAGPAASILASSKFALLLRGILDATARQGAASNHIKSFRFVAGHPGYPVFWDFAFLFLGNEEHVLLVGASSD